MSPLVWSNAPSSLGIYLLVKGFKPSGIERLQADPPGGPDTAGGPNSLALSPPRGDCPHRRDP
jgi:hypothetical protein